MPTTTPIIIAHHHHSTSSSEATSNLTPTHLNTPSSICIQLRYREEKQGKMESSHSETESPVFLKERKNKKKKKKKSSSSCSCSTKEHKRGEDERWPRKKKVTLEGYIESSGGGDNCSSDQSSESGSIVGRTKSLTDEDLEDLKGCLDLGFGFNYDEIPELCNTLPALELCYSMSQRFILDDLQQRSPDSSSSSAVDDSVNSATSSSSPMVANWKISSPGDHPDEVKARLKYWAQAVACTVRLCS